MPEQRGLTDCISPISRRLREPPAAASLSSFLSTSQPTRCAGGQAPASAKASSESGLSGPDVSSDLLSMSLLVKYKNIKGTGVEIK